MSNILLLRSPSETTPDPYERILGEASYSSHSIPVLDTAFTNLESLQHIIAAGPGSKSYAGVIITSKRSCEALDMASKILSEKGFHYGPTLSVFCPFVLGFSEAHILVQSLGQRFPSMSLGEEPPPL
jgi:uroporphyrinogen-III synthase